MTSIAHDTLTFSRLLDAPLSVVWAAFADSTQRTVWGVPEGEAQVYDESNFGVGGRDVYRCGPPETLEFSGIAEYLQIVTEFLIVHTDVVAVEGQVLAAALLTWQFESRDGATQVQLTDQVTSFVGVDMIDGHRNGHTKALEQLRVFVEGLDEDEIGATQ
ncbi:SRPBCC domain-containing protein [Arthrobacter flavus]|uniref:SRPBCC domain-containing protein n=1 Tax=Arthrobacter flavus TaxID=95172 RepID=A0ABW4Q3T5_9MICC